MTTVTYDDVVRAAAAIEGAVERTPSAPSRTLSALLGCSVVLKFEIFQFTASFKERGARNRLVALDASQRTRGVVAVSAGNHAQAVAYHAGLLGIPATIVMPEGTPFVKIARTQHLGATVELHGRTFEEALTRGHELTRGGATFVHPYDDPLVVAGQGTVALELLADHPEIEAIVVPVGGGGLLSGVLTAVRGAVPVVGVQSDRYPSLRGGGAGGPTLAEGIAVKDAGRIARETLATHPCDVVTVSEDSIEAAVNMLLEIEKVVVEGAGAVGIAALIEHRELLAGKTVGVVLTGGNIDPRLLASIIQRGLVRDGRLSRIRVVLDDRPGALVELLAVIAREGANVVEVHHHRVFGATPAKSVDVELSFETSDIQHRTAVIDAIGAAGFRTIE